MAKLNLQRFKPVALELKDYLQKLKSRGLGPDGRQVPDGTPMAPPIGYKKQQSMVEIVREMVRSERLKQEAENAGAESFEDADDFDVGDDPDQLKSGWENDFDPPVRELIEEVDKSRKKKPPSDGPNASTDAEPPDEGGDAKPA